MWMWCSNLTVDKTQLNGDTSIGMFFNSHQTVTAEYSFQTNDVKKTYEIYMLFSAYVPKELFKPVISLILSLQPCLFARMSTRH